MTVERTGGALKRGHCRAGIAGAGGAGRCIAYIVRFLGNGLALLLTLASAGVAAGPAGQSDSESTMGRGAARPATLDCADWDAGTFFEAAGPRDVAACLDVGVDLDHGLRQAVAHADDPATVQALIDAGANPNVAGTVAGIYNKEGHYPPLNLALFRNRGSAVIRILLDAGADILAEDSTGRTALAYAPWALRVSAEDLRILAAAARTKVGFEQRDSWDLVHAILEEDGSRLRALLAAGADPDSPVSGGGRLMDVAARFGSAAAVQSLVAAGADPSAANERDDKPLSWAVHGRNADAVRALIGEGADPDHMGDLWGPITALQYAAGVAGPDVLTALLEGGGDADVTDRDGHGLLHYVVDRAVPDVESAALMAAKARALIAGGVSPNAKQGFFGRTPLHDAVYRQAAWLDLIRVLVEGGANPRQRDKFGRTVLHYAAQHRWQGDPGSGYPDAGEVIGFLVDAGAPVAGRDQAGRTALHEAADRWKPGPVAGVIRALVANGVEIDARDEDGNTALHLAAASRSPHAPAAIAALMDLGADTRRLNARGETAWNVAAENEDVRQSEAYWRLNDARFAQGRDGRGRAGEPVPSVAPEAERVARTKGPSACEIPGFPNALDGRSLELGWCPSGVDFQVRVLALQAAGAWCGLLGETSATPAQIDAREVEIVAACDRLDALAGANSGPSCQCAPDYRP